MRVCKPQLKQQANLILLEKFILFKHWKILAQTKQKTWIEPTEMPPGSMMTLSFIPMHCRTGAFLCDSFCTRHRLWYHTHYYYHVLGVRPISAQESTIAQHQPTEGADKLTTADAGSSSPKGIPETNAASFAGRLSVAEVHKGPAIVRTSHSIRSRPQPNLLYVPGLRSLPFWTQQQSKHPQREISGEYDTNRVAYGDPTITAIVKHLDQHYDTIWQEYLSNYNNDSDNIKTTYVNSKFNSNITSLLPDQVQTISSMNSDNIKKSENNEHDMHLLNKGGKWDWHSYMTKGTVLSSSSSSSLFHQAFPQTASVLEALRNNTTNNNPLLRNQLLEHIPFGYVFFSTLHEQSHILPHTSPINFRLRIHVPLFVPNHTSQNHNNQGHKPTCGIRVGNTIREWHTGKSLVLDDSYEHEVWNDHPVYTTSPSTGTTVPSNLHHNQHHRVILLVDIWHPDITHDEREEICYMFQTAKEQGWLSK